MPERLSRTSLAARLAIAFALVLAVVGLLLTLRTPAEDGRTPS